MSSYLSQFEKTRRELYEIESQIQHLTGRDLDDVTAMTEELIFVKRIRSPAAKKSTVVPSDRPTSYRPKPSYTSRKRPRERESSYEEYSSDEEPPRKKPVIKSTIVDKSQNRSRKDIIEEQNANSNLRMRNQRMFGAMVATLKKFQREEVERQKQETMRAEIESKLEAAKEKERERIKQEKEHLFVIRREKQLQLRCLEKKIERAESHETFDGNHHHLLNFIITKSQPPIFFCPSSHTAASRKAHKESKSKIEELIKKQKASFESDLQEIDESYKKDSQIPTDKESESKDVLVDETESVLIEEEDNGPDSNYENSNFNLYSDEKEDSIICKNIASLVDEEFEPIYD